MKALYLFLFLLFGLKLTAQKSSYMHLEGKVGEYPVSMDLLLNAHTLDETGVSEGEDKEYYSAYYYYNSQEKPIFLFQKDTLGSELILLQSWTDEGEPDELFEGTLSSSVYKGTWSKGGSTLPFEFKKVSGKDITELVYERKDKVVTIESNKTEEKISGRISFDWFTPKDEKMQKELVGLITENSYTDFGTWADQQISSFEKDYKTEVNDYLKEMEGEDIHAYTLAHSYAYDLSPVINTDKYLIMTYSTYTYLGGAHGFSTSTYYTYSKKLQKWMTVNDVFDMRYESRIVSVLDREVRAKHKIPEGVSLQEGGESIFITDAIGFSENFSLDKKGITFHYGLYELTPYSYGYYDLFVPYEKLLPYLKKGFQY